MIKSITHHDVLWGYASSILNISSGLILLPLILHYLSREDVGLWFVFVTLGSLVQILEFGFLPTLTRNAAYVYAGAQSLNKVGLPSNTHHQGEIDQELLEALVAASRRIYQIVAASASAVLLLCGSYYISTLLMPSQDLKASLLAWLAFAFGNIVNFYYGYVNGLLQGRGDVTQANKVIVISRSALILFGGASVAFGYGMLGLGIASMLSAILGRLVAYRFFYAHHQPSSIIRTVQLHEKRRKLIKVLWHNSSRLGGVQLATFLILRGNILIASSFLGLVSAASYSMTVNVLLMLFGVAIVICQLQLPYMSSLQIKGDHKTLVMVYAKIIIISWVIYSLGLISLLVFGDNILLLIGSHTKLLSSWYLFLLGIIFMLEMNHSIAGMYLTTTNHIPFVNAALLSGFSIFLLSLITIRPWGVIGLILAQGIVQALYNNWKWPQMVQKQLRFKWLNLITMGANGLLKQVNSKPDAIRANMP